MKLDDEELKELNAKAARSLRALLSGIESGEIQAWNFGAIPSPSAPGFALVAPIKPINMRNVRQRFEIEFVRKIGLATPLSEPAADQKMAALQALSANWREHVQIVKSQLNGVRPLASTVAIEECADALDAIINPMEAVRKL